MIWPLITHVAPACAVLFGNNRKISACRFHSENPSIPLSVRPTQHLRSTYLRVRSERPEPGRGGADLAPRTRLPSHTSPVGLSHDPPVVRREGTSFATPISDVSASIPSIGIPHRAARVAWTDPPHDVYEVLPVPDLHRNGNAYNTSRCDHGRNGFEAAYARRSRD
jgi:hypothetical protein